MLFSGAECLFLGWIWCVSGLEGQQKEVCVVKGSSLRLPCSHEILTSTKSWYTGHWDGFKFVTSKLPADDPRMAYKSRQHSPTLTISDVRDVDGKLYCCSIADKPQDCRKHAVHVTVFDIQVKVIPTADGLGATLTCSTSCHLTENPADYIWYKNGLPVAEDWSGWYHEPVSSPFTDTYSCAVRGHTHLRAPELSVVSVTQDCLTVTYAGGRMCSPAPKSTNESCSLTYPKELHSYETRLSSTQVRLACRTTCPQSNSVISIESLNRNTYQGDDKFLKVRIPSADRFFCAVKDQEDLNSALVCADDAKCWKIVYGSRRVCALRGSSVNISCSYYYSESYKPKSNYWYQIKREKKVLMEDGGKVQFDDTRKNQQVLVLNDVQKNDSAEYQFNVKEFDGYENPFAIPGVTLVVTDLRVKVSPSPEVTEGQRVTLTCSTSCPLTHNSNYTWFFNGEPLSSNTADNKHLTVEAVGLQHAGNYSCAVRSGSKLSYTSDVQTLKVQSVTVKWEAAVGGASVVLLLLILVSVILWVRRQKASPQPRRNASSSEQSADVSAGGAEEELHYSTVHFATNTSPLYSLAHFHQPQEPEGGHYSTVNIKADTRPV